MVLLRRVIGDALRARRQGQHRTLREVSTAANVSLGYLSEIERGQKEASSELLAAICDALGARLSEVLGEVSDTLALAEQVPGVLLPVRERPVDGLPATDSTAPEPASAGAGHPDRVARAAGEKHPVRTLSSDGRVSVSVTQEFPLKATLRTSRRTRGGDRDVVCAA
ncbi:helix-turn-helix domain-containing protein [Plantactinospora sp. KBS50]|uniref:helix-turn-helix domain-containing protein n=1 Tax=Plantactinospora sp. KBS50 TaxID=2024580 RepID=UPI000BAAC852|nr:helix-turn-helix transcriptional regulator [Plantactinospora sp. KBS50]ASW54096.1 transcriptional regulator [Plantactinospora sp. KBS50]